jgi:hypothetical protein
MADSDELFRRAALAFGTKQGLMRKFLEAMQSSAKVMNDCAHRQQLTIDLLGMSVIRIQRAGYHSSLEGQIPTNATTKFANPNFREIALRRAGEFMSKCCDESTTASHPLAFDLGVLADEFIEFYEEVSALSPPVP